MTEWGKGVIFCIHFDINFVVVVVVMMMMM